MSLESQNYEDRKLANQSRRANITRSLDLPDAGIRGQNRLKGRINVQPERFTDEARGPAVFIGVILFIVIPTIAWAVVKLKETLHH